MAFMIDKARLSDWTPPLLSVVPVRRGSALFGAGATGRAPGKPENRSADFASLVICQESFRL
jgi:hypothetical protein